MEQKNKMLVTEALNELKLLDKRIEKEISKASFAAAAKEDEEKVTPSVTKEDFIKNAKASHQSIYDLINRKQKIKKEVLISNANTKISLKVLEFNTHNIKLCEKEVTVAEAIEMKNTISFYNMLLTKMICDLDKANAKVNANNIELEKKTDNAMLAIIGKENKNNNKQEEEFNNILKKLVTINKYSLINPLNLEDKIQELRNYIETFEAEIDAKLQISNCVTYIEI